MQIIPIQLQAFVYYIPYKYLMQLIASSILRLAATKYQKHFELIERL